MTINQEAVHRQAEARINNRIKNRDANIKQLDILRKKTGQKFDLTKVETPARLAERARRMGLYEDASAILRDPKNTELGFYHPRLCQPTSAHRCRCR